MDPANHLQIHLKKHQSDDLGSVMADELQISQTGIEGKAGGVEGGGRDWLREVIGQYKVSHNKVCLLYRPISQPPNIAQRLLRTRDLCFYITSRTLFECSSVFSFAHQEVLIFQASTHQILMVKKSRNILKYLAFGQA